MNNDEDLQSRLSRMRPADPSLDLRRRLLAAEPSPARAKGWPPRLDVWRRPWPLAYAGLLAAWALILVLRLSTPREEGVALPVAAATRAGTIPADAPMFAGTLAAQRTFMLGRHDPDLF